MEFVLTIARFAPFVVLWGLDSSPYYSLHQKRHRPRPGFVVQEKRPRINNEIRVPTVFLVSDEGKTATLPIAEALAMAQAAEMDLIEISPKAVPPVVKIGDIGRYMYQQRKKEQQQKVHNKQSEVKTLRFGFKTEKHDLDRLLDKAKEFLEERHLVKFLVQLRGRENTNKDYAKKKLSALVAEIADISDIEQPLKAQGNQFSIIVRGKRS